MANDSDIFGALAGSKQDDSAIFKDIANHKPIETVAIPQESAKPVDSRAAAWQAYKQKSQELSENFANEAGAKVTDLTGSPAAGAITNFTANAVPALFGGQLGTVANPATQGVARWLMRSALKPTSTANVAKTDTAVETMLKEGANPTAGGVDKLKAILGDLGKQVHEAVSKSGATVDSKSVADYVANAYERFKNGPQAVQAIEDLGNVQKTFIEHPNVAGARDIPVEVAQDMKQGYQRAIGDKDYGEIKTPITEGEKQIARGLREKIAEKVPAVTEPLKREADVITALKMAERRAAVDANKNPIGLGILNPAYLPIWLWDRSTLGKALTARALYSGNIPALTGASAGALYGNGALYQQ